MPGEFSVGKIKPNEKRNWAVMVYLAGDNNLSEEMVWSLQEMKDLHVTVVPKAVTIGAGNRTQNQHDYDIDGAVQKKLSQADNEEIDTLMTLVDEIADHFRFKRLDSAVWTKTENNPVFIQDHLDQLRQFTSVLTLTFRVFR